MSVDKDTFPRRIAYFRWVLQGGDTVDLGKGHVLEFVIAPNLHWPDTIFTFDRGSGVLFTCDAFGMHYCSETVCFEMLYKTNYLNVLLNIMQTLRSSCPCQ